MLFEYYVDNIGTVFTKKNKAAHESWNDFQILLFGEYSGICECFGETLDDFFKDEYGMLTNELQPHNRELITRFYNDPNCETIYWNLLEKYYGDNATGEIYIYQPPKRKKFLGIF